jgi:lipid-A-disaccharide synthase
VKYYLIAGEASGDLHGSNLLKALKKIDPHADFRGYGGDLMAREGMTLLKHIKQLAFMGFVEVLLNLKTIFRNLSECKRDIVASKPDVLIFIDYPGFNLRIAEWAKKQDVKTVYYISPQIWAWNQGRVHKIKQIIAHMLVILPFEKDFYAKFGMQVQFVGHPLLDAINQMEAHTHSFKDYCQEKNLSGKPLIALLPGSRKQEIQVMLPRFIEVVDNFQSYEFVIAAAPSQEEAYYSKFIKSKNIKIIQHDTYRLLQQATAAIVSSGTATLETALFDVPQVVCYKGNFLSYLIARLLVKVKFISLVNLIMDRQVVTELIQAHFTTENLRNELASILPGTPKRESILKDYNLLRETLGGDGASERAANAINSVAQNQ